MAKKSNIKHLLVIRRSAMGDVAMVVHAIKALREGYPDLKITLLTKELFKPLFDGLNVNIITIDPQRHKGLRGLNKLANEIVELGVDCVADLHGVLRSRVISILLKLRGIPSKKIHKSRLSKWMRIDGGCGEATQPLKHTVQRYCDTLRKLGLTFPEPKPAVKKQYPNPMPYDKGNEKWVGIAPFSVHQGKKYPIYLVKQVIEALSAKYDRVFVHSGGEDELKFALEMESNYENVVAVFAALKLAQEIDLIANLDCIITMDSFAMHVASITATPVVSVWGATHPSLGFSPFGCSTDGIVQLDLPCRPCSTYGNKKCKFNDYRCMSNIKPTQILEKVDECVG